MKKVKVQTKRKNKNDSVVKLVGSVRIEKVFTSIKKIASQRVGDGAGSEKR
jgi:hypothetical protein